MGFPRRLTGVGLKVQVCATSGAEPLAGLAAEVTHRKGQENLLADHLIQVYFVVSKVHDPFVRLLVAVRRSNLQMGFRAQREHEIEREGRFERFVTAIASRPKGRGYVALQKDVLFHHLKVKSAGNWLTEVMTDRIVLG